jgi:threonine dehydratase
MDVLPSAYTMTDMSVTLADIRAAADRIRGAVYRSPCPYSLALSKLCGAEVFCKLDHLQMTGSFKERGARNKLMRLSDVERQRGVIAASAGNHALGVAYHGHLLGIRVTVVMPRTAPLVKISKCRGHGAEVILHGENLDDARVLAREMAEKNGATYIHGFDDPDIIAGQGTVGLEILEDIPDVDAVIVPVGGGGLIAGVGAAMKALKPSVRIIGVESERAPTLRESLARGAPTRIATRPTLADGLAVSVVGDLCFEIARTVVDEVVLVDEGEIASAVLRLLELEKMVIEGSAAVSLAAITGRDLGLRGKRVVLVLCGGNIDVTVLARIIERGLARDGRLCRLRAEISDRAGSLAAFLTLVATTGASIKDVTHDRQFASADVALTGVSLVLETRDRAHIEEIGRTLTAAGVINHIETAPT